MSTASKQAFLEMIGFVLEEYSGRYNDKHPDPLNGNLHRKFGTLTVVISNELVNKPNEWIRRYDVHNENGANIVSFLLGNASMLFAARTQSFRQELLGKYSIKGVITLKQRVFMNITIPAAIIVLNKSDERTWFTSAENKEILINTLLSEFSQNQIVYWSKTLNVKNLMPEYYNGDQNEIEKTLNANEVKKLGEIASVITGKVANIEDFTDAGIPYLRGRDIQNGKIIVTDKHVSAEMIDKFAKQLVQEGDILLTKNFGQKKLALVTEDNTPAIASNGLFIIRPYDVTEGYLYKYLISKTGNEVFAKQISHIQKGVTIPSINLSDLCQILVPVYDKETMDNFQNMDQLSENETIEAVKQFARSYIPEAKLAEDVYKDLVAAGWITEDFQNEPIISPGNDRKWRPDFVYKLPDNRRVYFEVKADFAHVEMEWIHAITSILYGKENCFFILTTGFYYEVHKSGVKISLKSRQAPTLVDIFNWEKEVR